MLLKVSDSFDSFVAWILSFLFLIPATKEWMVNKVRTWSGMAKFRCSLAWHLQKAYARATNGHTCDYCTWTVLPGEFHEYCEGVGKAQKMSDEELLKAWNEPGDKLSENWDRLLQDELHRRGIHPCQNYPEDAESYNSGELRSPGALRNFRQVEEM